MNSLFAFLANHRTTFLTMLFLCFFSVGVSYAVPPSTPYSAGETLDPACAPGAANCYVAVGGGGSSYIFGNGLTEADGVVNLGGEYTINSTDYPAGFLSIGSMYGEAGTLALTDGALGSTAAYLTAGSLTGSDYAFVNVEKNLSTNTAFIGMQVGYDQIGNTMGMLIQGGSNAEMTIYDSINNKGIEYDDDYSANFTDRSLVDKAYVDSFTLLGSTSRIETETWIGTYPAALASASTTYTVFVGAQAGIGSTGSTSSIFVGAGSGSGSTNVTSSIMVGAGVGGGANTVDGSIILGVGAAGGINSTSGSIILGAGAGNNINNTLSSVFIGPSAGSSASVNSSVFLGSNAGSFSTAAFSNFIGTSAGISTTGDYSNFIGFGAGSNATNADNSIFIGRSAGANDTVNNSVSGTSILIGNFTSTGGFSDSIALGRSATNTAVNQMMIGSSITPINSVVILGSSSQSCTIRPDTVGISCSSDEQLKTNITDLSGEDTLSKLLDIRTVSYNWNNTPDSNEQIGFIAQDLRDQFPTLVSRSSNGYLQVNYAGMTPILTRAIQEINFNITDIADLSRENTWRDSLVAWFADAENGIKSLVVKDTLCINETCVTEDQLKALLQQQGGAIHSPSTPADPVDETPVIPSVNEPDAPEEPVEPSAPEEPEQTESTTEPADSEPIPEVPSEPAPAE